MKRDIITPTGDSLILEPGDLSVIIPITKMSGRLENLKNVVKRLINSNVEVLLIHDYQDADTSTELSLFKKLHPTTNLVLIEGQYGSPGMARNAGLNEAHGRFVTFWDSDDEPQVDEYLKFADKTISMDFDLGLSGFSIKNKTGEVRDFQIANKDLSLELTNIAIRPGLWRFIFNRKVLDNLYFSNSRMGEDQVFIVKAILNARRAITFRASTYQYLIGNEGQLTQNKVNIRFIIQSLRDISEIDLRRLDPDKKTFVALVYWKMFLTLVKNNRHKGENFSYIEQISSLRSENRELFRRFLIQLGNARNYWRLK